MMRRSHKQPNSAPVNVSVGYGDAQAWLSAEIELIIRERERLLQAAGAAAALFATLDPQAIPREAIESVRRLGDVLQSLPEETLTDAIETSLGQRAAGSRLDKAH